MPGDNYAGTGHTLEELDRMQPLTLGRVLVDSYAHLSAVVETFTRQLAECRSMIGDYASKQDATIIDGTEYELKLSSASGTKTWEYDLETLSRLAAFLPPDVVEKALIPVPATIKPNKTELNKLAKRGGEIRDIIESGCIVVERPGAPKIDLVRKTSSF